MTLVELGSNRWREVRRRSGVRLAGLDELRQRMLQSLGRRGRRKSSREPGLSFSSDNESPPPVHPTVPPVLHSIVAATRELPCDLGPTPSQAAYELINLLPFVRRDGIMS